MYGVNQGQYTQTRQAIRPIFGNESQNIDPIVLLDVEELKQEKIFALMVRILGSHISDY